MGTVTYIAAEGMGYCKADKTVLFLLDGEWWAVDKGGDLVAHYGHVTSERRCIVPARKISRNPLEAIALLNNRRRKSLFNIRS
jgi:hypothetical protein